MTLPRLALVSLALLLLGGCSTVRLSAARAGMADARREIEAGTLALEVSGYASEFPNPYKTYLSERGVEFRPVASCLVNEHIIGHLIGFNRIMKRAIRKKLGPDIFEKAEAQRLPE